MKDRVINIGIHILRLEQRKQRLDSISLVLTVCTVCKCLGTYICEWQRRVASLNT